MKRKLTLFCCCLLVATITLTTAACTTSQSSISKYSADYEKTITATRTEIWKAISGGGVSSAAVAISDNGKIVYEEGFALANRAEAIPVDTNTQFNIGSVSKMFVTMAVLQLCQEGKLDLEYVNSLGAGGITSNARDLCKFGDAILEGKILNKQWVDESFSAQYGSQTVPTGTPKSSFGLGWDSVNDEAYQKLGVRSIYKSGDTNVYHSMLYLLPDQNISIALTFSGPVDTTAVTDVIVKTLLAEKGVIPTETAETVPTAMNSPGMSFLAAVVTICLIS